MPDYEQLYLFSPHEKEEKSDSKKLTLEDSARVSKKTLEGFAVASIPFIGCDYEQVYPVLANIIPKEQIVFYDFPLRIAMVCEIICSAICHQMNWDFLRGAVRDKTVASFEWLSPKHLSQISETEVFEMLSDYSKPERVHKEERTMLLRSLGKWLCTYDSVEQIFLDKNGTLLSRDEIQNRLLACEVFSNDPEGKKMQLLMQKLSSFHELAGLSLYYQPAIDYHLVRVYLRRGLLIAKTQYAANFLNNSGIERKESTMAAIRQLCAHILSAICEYTELDISIVNQIEWHIGRSICVQGEPDCFLKSQEAQWVNEKFSVCPFFNTCVARSNDRFLSLDEPTYKGVSY